MNLFDTSLAFVIAYLLGSIPAAVWIGKTFHNIDVRQHGSGNAGTANVIRVLGWKTGIPVLIIDIGKGWLATMMPVLLNLSPTDSGLTTNLKILAGLTAIAGHVFPVFAGFKGGKGVASVFGMLLALHPLLTICCFAVFLTVLFFTGIVSVSSMSAGIAFPILLLIFFDTPSVVFKIFSVLMAVVLLITHRNNIRRLIHGEEKKLIRLRKK